MHRFSRSFAGKHGPLPCQVQEVHCPLRLKGQSASLIVRAMTRLSAFLFLLLSFASPVCAAEQRVTVFAAASLRGVLGDISDASGFDVSLSFGGSGTMARQIGAGAPADVVVLANDLWMDWLVDQNIKGMGTPQVVAQNSLVLIAPAGATRLAALDDLPTKLSDNRLAMGQRDAVPAGTYARQWLENAGLWNAIKNRLAETDNVRSALVLVSRGDVAFGVVYATDALAEPAVQIVWNISPQDHDPIRYLAAALTPSGETYLNYLAGDEASAIFTAQGFLR